MNKILLPLSGVTGQAPEKKNKDTADKVKDINQNSVKRVRDSVFYEGIQELTMLKNLKRTK
jgi:hypothetical protein